MNLWWWLLELSWLILTLYYRGRSSQSLIRENSPDSPLNNVKISCKTNHDREGRVCGTHTSTSERKLICFFFSPDESTHPTRSTLYGINLLQISVYSSQKTIDPGEVYKNLNKLCEISSKMTIHEKKDNFRGWNGSFKYGLWESRKSRDPHRKI